MQNDETLAMNSLKGFKLGHLNITSLPKHVDELRLQLTSQPVDALGLHETRLYTGQLKSRAPDPRAYAGIMHHLHC